MSTSTKKKQLQPVEWDFRGILENEVYAATKYEFIRESPDRKRIEKWQNRSTSKIMCWGPDFKKRYGAMRKGAATIRDAIILAYDLPLGPQWDDGAPGCEQASQFDFFSHLSASAASDLGFGDLSTIAARVPEFPKAWQDIRSTVAGEHCLRLIGLRPKSSPSVSLVGPEDSIDECFESSERCHVKTVSLFINPRRHIDDLQADFLKVINELGGPELGTRGRKNRTTFLKKLAAYRLDRAGVKWNDVQLLFDTQSEQKQEGDEFIPIFASEQLWTKATEQVADWLSGDFLSAIEDEFKK